MIVVRNVLVHDIIVTGSLKLLENFSIKFSKVEDWAFIVFLFNNSKVFLLAGMIGLKFVNSEDMSEAVVYNESDGSDD